MAGSYNDNLATRDFILKHSAELKIVIPGNHDLTLDDKYMATKKVPYMVDRNTLHSQDLTKIRELWTGVEAKKNGIVYLEEGVKSFTTATGTSFSVYTSPYTPEFCGWAFPYPRSEDRFNSSQDSTSMADKEPQKPVPSAIASPSAHPEEPVTPGVDIMVTHGPPLGLHDWVFGGPTDLRHVGCVHLRRAVRRCRPRLHVFGHIHEGYGATRMRWGKVLGPGNSNGEDPGDNPLAMTNEAYGERGERILDTTSTTKDNEGPFKGGQETLFVNASMLTESYRPENHPWVVDLELPVQDKNIEA